MADNVTGSRPVSAAFIFSPLFHTTSFPCSSLFSPTLFFIFHTLLGCGFFFVLLGVVFACLVIWFSLVWFSGWGGRKLGGEGRRIHRGKASVDLLAMENGEICDTLNDQIQ